MSNEYMKLKSSLQWKYKQWFHSGYKIKPLCRTPVNVTPTQMAFGKPALPKQSQLLTASLNSAGNDLVKTNYAELFRLDRGWICSASKC